MKAKFEHLGEAELNRLKAEICANILEQKHRIAMMECYELAAELRAKLGM